MNTATDYPLGLNPVYRSFETPSHETETHEIPCFIEATEAEQNATVSISVYTLGRHELVEVDRVENNGHEFSCIEDDVYNWLRNRFPNAQIKLKTL